MWKMVRDMSAKLLGLMLGVYVGHFVTLRVAPVWVFIFGGAITGIWICWAIRRWNRYVFFPEFLEQVAPMFLMGISAAGFLEWLP